MRKYHVPGHATNHCTLFLQASQKWTFGGFNEKIAKNIPVMIQSPGGQGKTFCSRTDMNNVAREKCKQNPGMSAVVHVADLR
jgi:hypothetical protein